MIIAWQLSKCDLWTVPVHVERVPTCSQMKPVKRPCNGHSEEPIGVPLMWHTHKRSLSSIAAEERMQNTKGDTIPLCSQSEERS